MNVQRKGKLIMVIFSTLNCCSILSNCRIWWLAHPQETLKQLPNYNTLQHVLQ